MPSFDTVSELNAHEVANAVDQANRELSQRFAFKDTGGRFALVCLEVKEPQTTLSAAHQEVVLRHGIDQDTGRKIMRLVKDSKLKLQASLQGDKVRISGKQRDELQAAIALLRGAKLDVPLQFNNFRE